MNLATIDPSIYCKLDGDELIGVKDSYVDNFLLAGTNEMYKQASQILDRLETTEKESNSFTLVNMYLTFKNGVIVLEKD